MPPTLEQDQTESIGTQRLRESFAACRLQFTWLGTTKTLTAEQKGLAASPFGAEVNSISAGKRLWDSKHPAYRAVTAVRGRIVLCRKAWSLPYPEPGVRMLRRHQIRDLDRELHLLQDELDAAVAELDRQFEQIKRSAGQRLGTLYNEADYPGNVREMFKVSWEFPEVDPPNYLRELHPSLYAEQSQRVAQRFDQAVELAESAFVEELTRLITHLNERLSGTDDGKPKIFRETAVENLGEFFARFRELNLRSNAELEQLVDDCQRIMIGVQPQTLRANDSLRRNIATQLAVVQSNLDQLMVDRPRRAIQRPIR